MTMTFLATRKSGKTTIRTIVADSIDAGFAALRRFAEVQLLSVRVAR